RELAPPDGAHPLRPVSHVPAHPRRPRRRGEAPGARHAPGARGRIALPASACCGSVAAVPEPRRILIADDEANIRKVLGAFLARDGYEVVEASDGEQALGLIGHGVVAIITDLRMPKVDGMTLFRR